MIVKNLKQYLENKGIAPSRAEKDIGLSNGALSKPFQNNKTIKTDTLEKFLNHYRDINLEWLIYNKGDITENRKVENFENESLNKILIKLGLSIKHLDKEMKALKDQDNDSFESRFLDKIAIDELNDRLKKIEDNISIKRSS